MEEMFKIQKLAFNIMADIYSKVYYNNLQGSPGPGRASFMSFFFFFLGLDQMAKLSKTFYEKNLQPREECYISFFVWINLMTQTGTFNFLLEFACLIIHKSPIKITLH